MIALEYYLLLTAGLVGVAVLLFTVGLVALRPDASVRSRIDRYLAPDKAGPVTILDLEAAEPFVKRVLTPAFRRVLRILAWMWPKYRLDELRHRLVLAGNPWGITTSDFIGLKGWCVFVIGGGSLLFGYMTAQELTTTSTLLLALLVLAAFFLPDAWISRRIRSRQQEIVRSLPDALDMLVVAMEAGLSFDNALLELTSRWKNALSFELMRVQREIGMGQPRRQALVDLKYRTEVPDIAAFVAAINQAEDLGVSIVRVLAVQAEEMRIKRRQRAQEQAQKAPVKMLFPMVFLIFPALFAVLLGPAVPSLLNSL